MEKVGYNPYSSLEAILRTTLEGVHFGGSSLWREFTLEGVHFGGSPLWRESTLEGVHFGESYVVILCREFKLRAMVQRDS